MDCDAHLITHLDPGEIHEGCVKHQPLRVADLGESLYHSVKLCFTTFGVNAGDAEVSDVIEGGLDGFAQGIEDAFYGVMMILAFMRPDAEGRIGPAASLWRTTLDVRVAILDPAADRSRSVCRIVLDRILGRGRV